jgi:hypothetical protein
MALPKLTCPECSTVLRPTQPVPAGKKIKCPRCDTVFVVGDEDDEEDEPPRKAASRKGSPDKGRKPARAKAPAAKEKPKKSDDEDEGVYGYVKDPSEEEVEEKKPKISYAPDLSIKDLRGPAQAMVMGPSNKLALCGFLGFLGWLVLIVLLLIPALFPIKGEKGAAVMKIGPGLGGVSSSGGMGMGMGAPAGGGEKDKAEDEKAGFFEVAGIDLSMVCDLPWYLFFVSLLPLVLGMFYSALVAYGAIQMQNLESRRWGIAGAIMAMLPFNIGGLQAVTAMVVQKGMGMVIDDMAYIGLVVIVFTTAEWLACVAIGIWNLTVLMNEDVIAGFEYVAE